MLSPKLHDVLVARFGDVTVVCEDEKMVFRHERDASSGRMRLVIISHGECFRVSCPFCGDTRKRLYINHRYNQFDPIVGARNKHLAKCFNEDCISDFEGREALSRAVFVEGSDALYASPSAPPVIRARPPGNIQLLDQLSRDHHARRFVEQKGFDPDYLAQTFRVGYCSYASELGFTAASNRLYIPVHMNGELRGWQARYIGDRDWKETGLLKYFSMPGMQRRQLLYNFDRAREFPNLVVLVEGPTDVWAVGENAVGLMGKDLSYAQLQLVKKHWGDGLVVVLMDADAGETALKTAAKLREEVSGQVLVVDLPPEADDPGNCETDDLWEYILDAANGGR